MRQVVFALVLLGVISSTAVAAGPTFYLAVGPHQCVIAPVVHKRVLVVPCSDAKHNEEVYAVGHATMPSTYSAQLAVARSVCLSAFQRVAGRPMASTEGWEAYWPDPGAERAKYGDKVICAYRHIGRLAPFGPGWHVR
jgi:hypothetical protein